MQTNKPFKMIAMAVLCLATWAGQVDVSIAQSDLADEDRATAMFDLQMSKMMKGDFADAMGEEFADMLPETPEGEVSPEDVSRVSGIMTIPNSIQDFQKMETQPLVGMDYLFKIEFADSEAAEKAIGKMKEEGGSVEIGGQTYFTNNEVEGMLGRLVNDTLIEVGTEKYLTQSSRDLLSANLKAAFNKTADVGFRLVIDLESESDLVAEAMAEATKESGGDPMAAGMIQLMDNMADLRLTFDLDADTMLSLAMTGKSEEDAIELQGGLDGMLGMAKMFGAGAADEIPDPELAKAAKGIIMGLQATREGNDVSINIARPENQIEAVKAAMDMGPMGGGF